MTTRASENDRAPAASTSSATGGLPERRSIDKVLVANRGEIAVRIIRGLRELSIRSVAVFSEADRLALHVRLADEAVLIGPGPSSESYLRIDRVVEAARRSGAQAIHPGYGFLAENPALASATEEAGLVFIGPSASAIESMGNKLEAHGIAQRVGVPLIPSSDGAVSDATVAAEVARRIGFPVMLKAAAGGGGKGMRIVREPEELPSALGLVRGEAGSAFGDDQVYLERYIEKPHHVEIQILCDAHGNAIYLGERDCSVQRRHQKVVEETPAPLIDDATRRAMGEAAVALAREVGYVNAGTVEFLVDPEGRFYFLEMNTRLQVEHPVTEMVTGIDIVKEQLKIAAGEPLAIRQQDIVKRGASMEFRIYAEDPAMGFMPSLGVVRRLRLPSGPGIRNDPGIYPGYEIPIHYDPLIAKLVVWGTDREDARRRAQRALMEYLVVGVRTNLPFHRWLVAHPRFAAGEVDTGFIGEEWQASAATTGSAGEEDVAMIAAAIQALEDRHRLTAGGDGAGGTGETDARRWRFQNRPGGC
jgi:acetyl-CoA carboxylase biotin carboxylase subunit